MAEPVDAWWARRQFSKGTDVPYAVGTYREVGRKFGRYWDVAWYERRL